MTDRIAGDLSGRGAGEFSAAQARGPPGITGAIRPRKRSGTQHKEQP